MERLGWGEGVLYPAVVWWIFEKQTISAKIHTYHVLHDSASGKLAHKNKSTSMHDFIRKNVIASSLRWRKEESGNKMNARQLENDWKKLQYPYFMDVYM